MTRDEMRVEMALQLLPQAQRVELWKQYGEGAPPLSVIIGATPQLDMNGIPF